MTYFGLFFLIVAFSSCLASATSHLKPSLSLVPGQTNWTNSDKSVPETVHFEDGSVARFILLHERQVDDLSGSYGFGFCFYCTDSTNDICYVAVLFVEMSNGTILPRHQEVVWSANREKPVGANAILEFSTSGDLVLNDGAISSSVWSTNTSGVQVSDMKVVHNGDLVLSNPTNEKAWESFNHLTDTLVDGQVLIKGQRLTSRMNSQNLNLSSGLFYLDIKSTSLSAYAKGDNPARYLFVHPNDLKIEGHNLNYVQFRKANFTFFYGGDRSSQSPSTISNLSAVQFLRLDADGGLRIHGWKPGDHWRVIHLFTLDGQDDCQLPLRCGRYGVCQGSNCTCPVSFDGSEYFKQIDSQFPNHGCETTSSQGTYDEQRLVNFGHLSYFSYLDGSQAIPGLEDEDSCVEACKRGASCKASFFKFDMSTSKGYCFLTSDVLTLMASPKSPGYYSSLHMKVQKSDMKIPSPSPSPNASSSSSNSNSLLLFVLASFACLLVVLMLTIVFMLVLRKRKIDDWFDHSLLEKISSEVLIKRYSYRELSAATKNFSDKLGHGGFGTVFKGVLKGGRVVAVKQLDTKQGTKEFLAEMGTLGKIHHVNLVRLIGFCVNRKNRMLVYEYMSKGSLDKWIFSRNKDATLDWNTRKKIATDIAKGLMYLHEECGQKIAHLDVKPHNILLDENFNAKISDFGLSKLINREESQVVTEARGTLGYLAPEWQHSRITVKADVYSYGIVLLEIICGRKILDYSKPHSDVHLLSLLEKKASEDRLRDMVDCQGCEDMKDHVEEAIDMMGLGMWCSDGDHTKRPSMSLVVKVLEGGSDVAGNRPNSPS